MQILNLKRDFESLRMQEDETINKYADNISFIVNNKGCLARMSKITE